MIIFFFFFVLPREVRNEKKKRIKPSTGGVSGVGSMHGPHAHSLSPWASHWGVWRPCSPQHGHSESTLRVTLAHLLHLKAHPSFFPLEPLYPAVQNGHGDTVSPPGQVPLR